MELAGFAALATGALWRLRAQRRAQRQRRDGEGRGHRVVLVGAGPGAVDLITVRGLEAVRRADVVVHDRLVAPQLVAQARSDALVINVGKAPTKKRYPQSEINRILVELATGVYEGAPALPPGATIVRLKGGDPFVFGLGGDEALALEEAGVQCEVVPGLSSSLAVPACVGVPVTQKGLATSFTVVSGHLPPGAEGAADWDFLPRRDATLVVLMGVKSLPRICEHLVSANGWAETTPVVVIESGTTPEEKVLRGDLASMPARAEAAGVKSPAIIVVGKACAALRPGSVVQHAAGSSSDGSAVWGLAQKPSL